MPKTLFLSVSDVRDLVGRIGLRTFTRRLADEIRNDYLRWPEFQKCPRTAHYSEVGVIELMPICNAELYAFKWVNGHPSNFRCGLPTVMGFGCLAEVATGWPLLLSELTILTAIRTAATSVVAAQALARPDSNTMAMIGNGAQSEFQVMAFHEMLGVRRVQLFDIDPGATQRLVDNLCAVKELELVPLSSVRNAVHGCDIVTTSTADKTPAAVLTLDMIEPGMHLNAIGGDCPGKTELHSEILRNAKVVVEFAEQARIEGEIQQMGPDFPVTELWEVLTGRRIVRESASDVTVFDSVGFSLEDFSTLSLVYDLARAEGIGSEIELVPTMKDVKDLYSLVSGSG